MKVTVVKENDKFYLDIERPHRQGWYDWSNEVRKVMRVIMRNIESYLDEDNSLHLQYFHTCQLMWRVRDYFTDNPNVMLIRMPYMREYPTTMKVLKRGFFGKIKDYELVFDEEFVKNEIKVLKVRG